MTTNQAKDLFYKAYKMLNAIKDKNNRIYNGPAGEKIRKKDQAQFNLVFNRVKIYYLNKLKSEPQQSNDGCGCS